MLYRDMIGGGLRDSLLVGVSTIALLSGCDLFDSSPQVSSKQRPGAERSVAASAGLPSAGAGHQYDSSIAPVDETRGGTQIGSVVAGKGGQKVQQEAMAKTALETDRRTRADADRQAADRKAADAEVASGKIPATTSSSTARDTQAAATPPAPVVTQAAPPPIQTADATPPPPTATVVQSPPPIAEPAPAVAAAPARPVDPNKAFEPPPGWIPPGRTSPIVTADAAPPAAVSTPASAPSPSPSVATSSTLLPTSPAPQASVASAPPPPPVAVASYAPPADPNKAFEPPPGWVPPGRTAPIANADSAPVVASSSVGTSTTLLPRQTASAAPPPVVEQPAVQPSVVAPAPVVVATARPANPNKAFEPPPGWTPPAPQYPAEPATASTTLLPQQTPPAQIASAAPPRPVVTPPPPAPPSPPVTVTAAPPQPVAPPVAPLPPATVTAPPTPLQTVAPPVVDTKADIANAQSGSVPFSAIPSPPGGPLQVAVIQFDRASSGLGGRDDDILRKVAQIQKSNGGTVRVVAHAEQDVNGASVAQIERGNYDVSRRRAVAGAGRGAVQPVRRGRRACPRAALRRQT